MATTFVPAEVFPPGNTIKRELAARGWTQADLAEIMGRPIQAVNEIISAKKRVTEETAKELEAALGIDAELWLRMETLYRLHHTEPAPSAIVRRSRLRARVPLRHLIARGWVEYSDEVDELEDRVQRFLGVTSLDDRAKVAMAAKQTEYDVPLSPTQEVWLLRVRQIAAGMPCAAYSEPKLRDAVRHLAQLRGEPESVRHVPRILADAGVRFVIVEKLPSLKVDGVCTWLNEKSPVIGLSFRFDRIDNFWFVLRHEIEHVLNRDGETILDSELEQEHDHLPAEEQRANAAAADFCVPTDMMDNFLARVGLFCSDVQLRGFARIVGVHPGIVAGQLRFRTRDHKRFTKYLVKVREFIAPNSIVDGFSSALPALG